MNDVLLLPVKLDVRFRVATRPTTAVVLTSPGDPTTVTLAMLIFSAMPLKDKAVLTRASGGWKVVCHAGPSSAKSTPVLRAVMLGRLVDNLTRIAVTTKKCLLNIMKLYFKQDLLGKGLMMGFVVELW